MSWWSSSESMSAWGAAMSLASYSGVLAAPHEAGRVVGRSQSLSEDPRAMA